MNDSISFKNDASLEFIFIDNLNSIDNYSNVLSSNICYLGTTEQEIQQYLVVNNNKIKDFFSNKENYEGVFKQHPDGSFYYQSIFNSLNFNNQTANGILFLNIYKNDSRFEQLFTFDFIQSIYTHQDKNHFESLLEIIPFNVFKDYCYNNLFEDIFHQLHIGEHIYENIFIFTSFDSEQLKEIKKHVKEKMDTLLLTKENELEKIMTHNEAEVFYKKVMDDANLFYNHLDYLINMKNLSNIQNKHSKGVKI